jgi:CrcB protein
VGHLRQLLLVGLGGAIGASIRWFVADTFDLGSFPWETLAVNVVGCALLAAVTELATSVSMTSTVAVGFCGGLTTFSTFAVEVVSLGQDGRPMAAIVYVAVSVLSGVAAFVGVRSLLEASPT